MTAAEPVPCVAHPGTGLVHLDGPCRCFYGGPPPEHPPLPNAPRHLAVEERIPRRRPACDCGSCDPDALSHLDYPEGLSRTRPPRRTDPR